MTFSLALTPAQKDLVERTHAFAENVIRPVAAEHDRAQEFPWDVLEKAAQEGFYSPLFYRDLIGDPTGLSLPLFMEELFWGCAGIGLAVVMPALALSSIGQAATPEQMLRWAPECFGEPGNLKLAALCISEPEGGSDVRNLRTTATRDGDEWVIEGHKMWIGNGGIADVHVVNATVDPDLGHRGQALFVIPGGSPGIELVRKLDKLGCRASHTAELKFHQVRVPSDHLLGGDDKLQNRMRKAREVQEEVATGAPRRKSATLGTFEQTRPWSPLRRWASPAPRRIRHRVREPPRGVRRPDHRQPGHRVSAGRPRNPDRRRATAHVAGVVDGGGGRGVPPTARARWRNSRRRRSR